MSQTHTTPSVSIDPPVTLWKTVTGWLLLINITVFAIDVLLATKGIGRVALRHNGTPLIYQQDDGRPTVIQYPFLQSYGYFSFDLAIRGGQLWRFLTYQFCHANLTHLFVNMMGLWLAGPIVEQKLGRARFLAFYLLCGIAGPLAHLIFGLLDILTVNAYTPLVGASASTYGVLLAAAMIAPDDEVMLLFPPIDLKLRTVAILMIGLSAAAVAWHWQNAGGHAAHIGGAVMGWILARRMLPKQNAGQDIPS